MVFALHTIYCMFSHFVYRYVFVFDICYTGLVSSINHGMQLDDNIWGGTTVSRIDRIEPQFMCCTATTWC